MMGIEDNSEYFLREDDALARFNKKMLEWKAHENTVSEKDSDNVKGNFRVSTDNISHPSYVRKVEIDYWSKSEYEGGCDWEVETLELIIEIIEVK
jgi:hypothetical protein